jgi:hypothetical protein
MGAVTASGDSILDTALEAGFTILAKALLNCDCADVGQLVNDPLYTAVRLGYLDIAETLISQGACLTSAGLLGLRYSPYV